MSFKLQAAMPSGVRSYETKPRRFDLTMSRRTRRPAAATSATDRHEQDHHQAVDVEGLGFQPMVVQPEPQDPDGLFCLSDHLQSRQHAHQEHETSEEPSEDTTQEQASPPQTCRLVEKDDESEAQQQQECQDNSRRFSLQELIEDEAVDDGVKDAATEGTEESAAAAREVAQGAAEKRPEQVPGRRMIGMMRRYVKVRSIKLKHASPEKNATPVC